MSPKMSPPNEKKPQRRSSPCLDFCHFGGRAFCLVAHTLGKNTQLQIIKSFPERFAPAYKTAGSTPCAGIDLNESSLTTTLVGRTSHTVSGICGVSPKMKGSFFHKFHAWGSGVRSRIMLEVSQWMICSNKPLAQVAKSWHKSDKSRCEN